MKENVVFFIFCIKFLEILIKLIELTFFLIQRFSNFFVEKTKILSKNNN
jgi:hypothetical protein